MALSDALEARVEEWRAYVRTHRVISPADVEELEDHLRAQVADLREVGLDDEESFLVAVKRIGNLDAVSREYAREHADRLWKHLALTGPPPHSDAARRELAVVLAAGAGAGLTVRLGLTLLDDPTTFALVVGLLVAPFLAAYLGWKRRIDRRTVLALAVPFVALAALLAAYPFRAEGSTAVLAALHTPVLLWLGVGVAYVGGRWRSHPSRMDFVRFTGELAIYYTLIAVGGAVLLALTVAVLALVDVDATAVVSEWVLPLAMPGALVVAAWLVEAKQAVVENIAPVLTRVFTPLTILMLLAVLIVLAVGGQLGTVDRDLLILMDAILVLVLCLLLYSISARDPLAPPGGFDAMALILVGLALAVDAVMLTAMLERIAQFGASSNKVAALGLNLLLLVHLAGTAWLTWGFLRRRRPFGALERWQTRYLPVYAAWAAVVVAAFPPLFGFA